LRKFPNANSSSKKRRESTRTRIKDKESKTPVKGRIGTWGTNATNKRLTEDAA